MVLDHSVVVRQLSVKGLPGLLLIGCSSLGVQYLFIQSLDHRVVLHHALEYIDPVSNDNLTFQIEAKPEYVTS